MNVFCMYFVCMYVCVYVYVCICVCIDVCVYVYVYVCICVCMCVCVSRGLKHLYPNISSRCMHIRSGLALTSWLGSRDIKDRI